MKNILYTRQTINTFLNKSMTLSYKQKIGFSVASLNGLNHVLLNNDKIYNNKLNTFSFSTNSRPIIPIKMYANADIQKLDILLDNKNKSGVYCFTNLTSGKKYVGSSVDLRRRLLQYFSVSFLTKTTYMPICNALLKYGYSSFSLEILEYCETPCTIFWEQFHLDSIKPEYNILTKAGSLSGYKHLDSVRLKLSELQKEFWKTSTLSLEDRKTRMTKVRGARLGKPHSEETKSRISASQPHSKGIEVFDCETNETNIYSSIKAAAKAMGAAQCSLSMYFKRNQMEPFKKRYVLKKLS